MKVFELIDALSKMDPDTEVYLYNSEYDDGRKINEAKLVSGRKGVDTFKENAELDKGVMLN